MFQGTKRAKEHEQIIAGQQEKLERMDRALGYVADAAVSAMDILEAVEREQGGFRAALPKVKEQFNKIRGTEEERRGKEEQLLRRLTLLSAEQGDASELYRQAAEDIRKDQEQFRSMAEQGRQFTEPARETERSAQDLLAQAGALEESLQQMKDFGRQMGVISLNAAIEAGRMGEAGRKFVSAAEEVRVFAVKYQEEAEKLLGRAADMKQALCGAQGQMAALAGFLEENGGKMEQAAQSFQGSLERLERAEIQDVSSRLNTLLKDWEEAAALGGGQNEAFEHMFSKIGRLEESSARERKALSGLKEELEKVLQETERSI